MKYISSECAFNLFEESKDQNNSNLTIKTEDFIFEDRLSKEFETLGFFISDHPINQFKDFFPLYKIINFNGFNKS